MATTRPLHRSRRHRLLGGVCGGFADWLGWDPTLVRVIYVAVSICSAAFPGDDRVPGAVAPDASRGRGRRLILGSDANGDVSPLPGGPEIERAPCGALRENGSTWVQVYGWPPTTPPASSIIFSEMIPIRSTPAPLAMSIAWTTRP